MSTIENLKIEALNAWQLAANNYGNLELLRRWDHACERLEIAESALR